MPRPRARVVPLLAALMLGGGLPAGALAQAGDPRFPGLSDTPPPFEGGGAEEPAGGGDGSGGGSPAGGGSPSGDGSGGGTPSGGGDSPGGGEPPGGGDPSRGQEDRAGGEDPAGDEDPNGDGPAAGDKASDEVDALPDTGGEPLLLGLTGAALALIGTGLRLRTLDAELF